MHESRYSDQSTGLEKPGPLEKTTYDHLFLTVKEHRFFPSMTLQNYNGKVLYDRLSCGTVKVSPSPPTHSVEPISPFCQLMNTPLNPPTHTSAHKQPRAHTNNTHTRGWARQTLYRPLQRQGGRGGGAFDTSIHLAIIQ